MSFKSYVYTLVWYPPSWNSHVARHVTWPILLACRSILVKYCVDSTLTAFNKGNVFKRLCVILWLSCNIFRKCHFYGGFPYYRPVTWPEMLISSYASRGLIEMNATVGLYHVHLRICYQIKTPLVRSRDQNWHVGLRASVKHSATALCLHWLGQSRQSVV